MQLRKRILYFLINVRPQCYKILKRYCKNKSKYLFLQFLSNITSVIDFYVSFGLFNVIQSFSKSTAFLRDLLFHQLRKSPS